MSAASPQQRPPLRTNVRTHRTEWFSSARTNVGHVRKANEDAFLDAQEQGLWVVADGMGGHSRGDRASQAIISALSDFSKTKNHEQDLNDILARLDEANQLCREESAGRGTMGSTVAALYVYGTHAYVIWAGDSRLYRYRAPDFVQLTDDHSLVQELFRLGELSDDDLDNHPSSNVITRAVGVHDTLETQVRRISVKPGDRFLLCSDGLFKDVSHDELKARCISSGPDDAVEAMMSLALRRGGTDNITAIVVQIPVAAAGPWPPS